MIINKNFKNIVILSVLLIFTIMFLYPTKITAKEINDIACNYQIKCKDPIDSKIYDLGYMQIKYTGYNDGNYEDGSVSIYYGEKEDSLNYDSTNFKTITPGKKFTDYYNYNFGNKKRNMYILHGDSQGHNFALLFEDSLKCPTMYCAVNTNDVYITIVSNYTSGYNTSNNSMSPIKTFLKNNDENEWLSEEEFYTSSTPDGGASTTKPKDPLVCEYNITPHGEYYDTGLNTSAAGETVNLTLTTNYHPTTGNVISYNVSANGYSPITPITTLDESIDFMFTGEGSTQQYRLVIEPDQLKKIFTGSCLSSDKIYLYLNKDLTIAGVFGYKLTTDKSEMEDNILDEDFDHDSSTSGDLDFDIEIPDLNISDKPMTCTELLGDKLIAVIKFVINLIRVGAVIATIVICMMTMLPAVTKGDAGEFNKAVKKCIWTVVVMLLIILIPVLLRTIGNLFSWDLCGLF